VPTLVFFGCDGIVYALLPRRVPHTIVQLSAVAQFVGVIIAASLVLGEQSFASALARQRLYLLWIFVINLNARVRKDALTPPRLEPPKPH
jgi:hypothetical protein